MKCFGKTQWRLDSDLSRRRSDFNLMAVRYVMQDAALGWRSPSTSFHLPQRLKVSATQHKLGSQPVLQP